MTGNLIWYNGFTAYKGNKGKGGKSHALSGLGGGDNSETDYRADIILALCEGPIAGHRLHLAEPVALQLPASDVPSVQRRQRPSWRTGGVVMDGGVLPVAGGCLCRHRLHGGGVVPDGHDARDRQPVVRGLRQPVRHRRQRHRRRPRAGDLRLPHQPALRRRLRPRLDRPGDLVRPRRRRVLTDLLQVARHRVLAADQQPGGGVLDPRPLAANLQLRARSGPAANSSSSPTATPRPTPATSRPSAATSPSPMSCRPTAAPPGNCRR